jgi:hypothetical protein
MMLLLALQTMVFFTDNHQLVYCRLEHLNEWKAVVSIVFLWVADAHQLLQSLLQRLSSSTCAMDASGAPSATRSLSSSGGGNHGQQQRRRHQQSDSQEDQQQVFLSPLV